MAIAIEWTKGNWRVFAGTARVVADLPTGETIVVHDGATDSLRHCADAQLIATAPKLYLALRKLFKQARKLEGQGFTGAELELAENALREAVDLSESVVSN
jgi:hypothetical protein